MNQTNDIPSVFVLIPFRAEYEDAYTIGIKETVEQRGYSCTKMDEEQFLGPIVDKILERIDQSDIIVAEVSESNPNVYYELGYAHGLGKEPVLIARKGVRLPFDIQSLRCIFYESSVSLRRQLTAYIQSWEEAAAKQPEGQRLATNLKVESQNVLRFLLEQGSPQPAAVCAEVARGVFAIMNDLRFVGFVRFSGHLRPTSSVYLTDAGRVAAQALAGKPN